MVKKRTLWLAAAAIVAAVAVAAVAGCKQDDEEDDWSPLTIRENVLERYTGQRQTVTVPDDVTAIGSKAFSGSDVTAVIIPGSVTGIAQDAFDGSKVEFISYLGTKEAWDELTRDGQADGIRVSCFIIDEKGVLIGYEGDETDVVIPAGIVKGIAADVFRSRTDITGVTVPGSVRDIADGAFSGCTALGRVHIDAGVARIGAGAFAGCTALTALDIPAGVTEIGGGAFRGCAVLTDLNVHESVTTIAPDAFAGCAGLKGEATKERERNGIFYRAKKIKWEKLLADGTNDGLEQALAGFTVHCTDGDWHGPDAGNTEIPGDPTCEHELVMQSDAGGHYERCTRCDYKSAAEPHDWSEIRTDDAGEHSKICMNERCRYTEPVDHAWSDGYKNDADEHYKVCTVAGCTARNDLELHDYRYDITDKDNHKAICKTCGYFKDDAHVYDSEDDGVCSKCGYQKENPGDPECEHDFKVEHNESGHYKKCTRCGSVIDSEKHDYNGASYENKGTDGHSRTCTTAGCGYVETAAHSLGDNESTGKDNHKVTCKDCEYFKVEEHTLKRTIIANDDDNHNVTCEQCDYSDTEAHNYGSVAYKDDGHHQTCADCNHTKIENHDYDGASFVNGGESGHYQTCTATGCGAHSESTPHELKYEKIDDNEHHETCTVCDYHSEPEPHEYEYTDNEDGTHTKTCEDCKYSVSEDHQYDDDTDIVCNDCEYKRPLPPGSYPVEGGTLTIDKNGVVIGYTGSGGNIIIPDGVTGIADVENAPGVFSGIYKEGTVVTIPDSVERIGKNAFAGSGVQEVEINGVKDIGDNAFKGCYQLTDVTIVDGTETIGKSAFEGCGKLETVTIPGSVTSIGNDAFNGCGGLTSVTIADGVKSIGSGAFAGCGNDEFTSITIPGSVTAIGNGAFQNCNGLTTAVIEYGVKEIAADMFEGCHNLESITIPQSVEHIGSGAFQECNALKTVDSLDGVKSIGDRAFQNCHGLESITIPDSVTSIGDNVFVSCSGLKNITISKNVTSIGKDALACGNLETITFTGTVAEWLVLSKDSGVGDNVKVRCTDGTVPWDIAEDKTLRHYYGRETDVEIPWNSVETIGEAAFAGTDVTTVKINDAKSIGPGAFQGCGNLTHVEIPMSIESIGYNAFAYCDNLTTITFAGTKKKWIALINANDEGIGLGDGVTVSGSGWTWPDNVLAVSVTGSDTNSGDLLHPFATIQKAVDTVIAMNDGAGEYTIYVDGTVAQGMGGGNGMADFSALDKNLTLTIKARSGTATLDAGGNSRVIYAAPASGSLNLILENIVITGGSITGNGGGLYVGSGGEATISGDTTISGCTATNCGGGVYVASGGTFKMSGTAKITGCTVTSTATSDGGGGIYNEGGSVEIAGGTISGCTAGRSGGGVCVHSGGTLTMTGGSISGNGNTTMMYGGGVYVNGGTFTMTNGTISGNTAQMGAGVRLYQNSTKFIMSGGEITGNTATNYGGGVYVNSGTFTITGGSITGNTKTGSTGKAGVENRATFNNDGGTVQSD